MKITELVKRVNKSKDFEQEVCIDSLLEEFNIQGYCNEEQERLKSYFVTSWHCTDSTVGTRVYYLDETPVCLTNQNGRKCNEDFNWLSEEAYLLVKEYLIEISNNEDCFSLIRPDQEINEYYKIEFNNQLYDYHFKIPFLNGRKVIIIKENKKEGFMGDWLACSQVIKIQFEDTKEPKWINVRELDFPLNLMEETNV